MTLEQKYLPHQKRMKMELTVIPKMLRIRFTTEIANIFTFTP
jgi:hypothetical protein